MFPVGHKQYPEVKSQDTTTPLNSAANTENRTYHIPNLVIPLKPPKSTQFRIHIAQTILHRATLPPRHRRASEFGTTLSYGAMPALHHEFAQPTARVCIIAKRAVG